MCNHTKITMSCQPSVRRFAVDYSPASRNRTGINSGTWVPGAPGFTSVTQHSIGSDRLVTYVGNLILYLADLGAPPVRVGNDDLALRVQYLDAAFAPLVTLPTVTVSIAPTAEQKFITLPFALDTSIPTTAVYVEVQFDSADWVSGARLDYRSLITITPRFVQAQPNS